MKFLNFGETKQEFVKLYQKNTMLIAENEKLKLKIKELEEASKQITIKNINVSAEDLAKEVARALNKSEKEKHECTGDCFKYHVLDPIQADIYSKFGEDILTRRKNLNEMVRFVETWRIKLIKEYPFLKDLYTRDFGELTAVYK